MAGLTSSTTTSPTARCATPTTTASPGRSKPSTASGGPGGRTNHSVGTYNAAVLYNGRPHVFYYDATDGALRHAYYNGVTWAFETLDGIGGPAVAPTTTSGCSTPSCSTPVARTSSTTTTGGGDLRHGYWNGQFWAFETLDGSGGPNGRTPNDVGQYSSVVLYGGRPHVFYYDQNFGGTLRHGYWNGQFWAFEVLDGNGGPGGRNNHDVGEDTATIISGGRPHVFYYDRTAGNLRRGRYTGAGWVFEHLDGNGFDHGRTLDDVGWFNAAVVSGGLPHVFYYDLTTEDLRHGWFG
ncbi:MAG: hypothetical protein M5U31_16380 [Acidimicrobiia bacterium]|nr:hypothetical protein [Acidimicrobiia bacterium]